MRPYLIEFERRLATDCLNTISMNNQIPFQLSMSSDLAGDSVIDISLQHESVVRFVAPTFTDGLFAPVITRDAAKAGKIANDMLYLVSEVVPNAPKQSAILAMQQGVPAHDAYMVTPYTHPVMPAAMYNPSQAQQGVMNAISFEGL